jgi:hypothetical protein
VNLNSYQTLLFVMGGGFSGRIILLDPGCLLNSLNSSLDSSDKLVTSLVINFPQTLCIMCFCFGEAILVGAEMEEN